jgi:hypothetical protein
MVVRGADEVVGGTILGRFCKSPDNEAKREFVAACP